MNLLANHKQSVISFDSHNAAAISEAYAEGAIVHDPQPPEPMRGRGAIRRDYEELFKTFPDIQTSITRAMVDGRHIAYHMILRGTHEGSLATPEGDIPPNGRRIALPAAVFAEANEHGRYATVRRFYDVSALMQQLGMVEEPA